MTNKTDISTSTFLRFILIILGLVFVYLVRDILLIIFFAIIIAAAIEDPVKWLVGKKVKRVFAVALIYFSVALFVALIFYLVVPPLVSQVKALVSNLPEISEGLAARLEGLRVLSQNLQISRFFGDILGRLEGVASGIFQSTFNFVGGLFSSAVVVVISFYLAIQERGMRKFLVSFTPIRHKEYVGDLVGRMEKKLGAWLRGELILMLLVGLLTYIGLTILGVKYALFLALIAGLFEVIPIFGPIISAVPAIILAFLQSPILALAATLLYYGIQQFESYVLVPQVMKKALGLNPLIIIIALLVGAKLAGVLGMIVAVPLTAMLNVFLSDIFKEKE